MYRSPARTCAQRSFTTAARQTVAPSRQPCHILQWCIVVSVCWAEISRFVIPCAHGLPYSAANCSATESELHGVAVAVWLEECAHFPSKTATELASEGLSGSEIADLTLAELTTVLGVSIDEEEAFLSARLQMLAERQRESLAGTYESPSTNNPTHLPRLRITDPYESAIYVRSVADHPQGGFLLSDLTATVRFTFDCVGKKNKDRFYLSGFLQLNDVTVDSKRAPYSCGNFFFFNFRRAWERNLRDGTNVLGFWMETDAGEVIHSVVSFTVAACSAQAVFCQEHPFPPALPPSEPAAQRRLDLTAGLVDAGAEDEEMAAMAAMAGGDGRERGDDGEEGEESAALSGRGHCGDASNRTAVQLQAQHRTVAIAIEERPAGTSFEVAVHEHLAVNCRYFVALGPSLLFRRFLAPPKTSRQPFSSGPPSSDESGSSGAVPAPHTLTFTLCASADARLFVFAACAALLPGTHSHASAHAPRTPHLLTHVDLHVSCSAPPASLVSGSSCESPRSESHWRLRPSVVGAIQGFEWVRSEVPRGRTSSGNAATVAKLSNGLEVVVHGSKPKEELRQEGQQSAQGRPPQGAGGACDAGIEYEWEWVEGAGCGVGGGRSGALEGEEEAVRPRERLDAEQPQAEARRAGRVSQNISFAVLGSNRQLVQALGQLLDCGKEQEDGASTPSASGKVVSVPWPLLCRHSARRQKLRSSAGLSGQREAEQRSAATEAGADGGECCDEESISRVSAWLRGSGVCNDGRGGEGAERWSRWVVVIGGDFVPYWRGRAGSMAADDCSDRVLQAAVRACGKSVVAVTHDPCELPRTDLGGVEGRLEVGGCEVEGDIQGKRLEQAAGAAGVEVVDARAVSQPLHAAGRGSEGRRRREEVIWRVVAGMVAVAARKLLVGATGEERGREGEPSWGAHVAMANWDGRGSQGTEKEGGGAGGGGDQGVEGGRGEGDEGASGSQRSHGSKESPSASCKEEEEGAIAGDPCCEQRRSARVRAQGLEREGENLTSQGEDGAAVVAETEERVDGDRKRGLLQLGVGFKPVFARGGGGVRDQVGVRVSRVEEGGLAERAGVRTGMWLEGVRALGAAERVQTSGMALTELGRQVLRPALESGGVELLVREEGGATVAITLLVGDEEDPSQEEEEVLC